MSRLQEILAVKAQEVEALKIRHTIAHFENEFVNLRPRREFRQTLLESSHPVALIAEVKKASPSQGLIRAEFDAEDLARTYQRAGADCLSVLTDEHFFQGALTDLELVNYGVDLPLLRKDFIIDRIQLYQSYFWGADCILLIVAALDYPLLHDLYHEAKGINLDVLVEVHNPHETDLALELGADMIGVNNRDLSTFETDLAMTDTQVPRITPHALAISESALATHADIQRAQAAGSRAVLIGTTFSGSSDPAAKVREVMNW